MNNTKRKSLIPVISVIVAAVVLFAVPSVAIAESGVSDADARTAPKDTAAAEASDYTVVAEADGRSNIRLQWSEIKDADGYTIYRSPKSDKRGKKVHSTEKATKASHKDSKALVGETYWYTVEAWKNIDNKKVVIAVIKAEQVENALKYKDSFIVKAYAYTGGGTTASGKKAQVGYVAVDPGVIELGTWLYVEDYGLCQAADTGGTIKGNKIDLYMDTLSECYEWGVRSKNVYILE
jgi:3D (Asp-Asp-Asp) domain-containing protein